MLDHEGCPERTNTAMKIIYLQKYFLNTDGGLSVMLVVDTLKEWKIFLKINVVTVAEYVMKKGNS